MPTPVDPAFAAYLKTCRGRLSPADFGLAGGRRRTQGLRREEVATRAGISVTWYTWLEQGRGGAPSADLVDRLAQALMLTEPERQHLHVLALGRKPEPAAPADDDTLPPRLQHVLDALPLAPALIRNPVWDVLAWNRATARVLFDFATLPAGSRNILRQIFCDPVMRAAQPDWHETARLIVGVFRADAARAKPREKLRALVADLSRASPEFAALWAENQVRGFTAAPKRWHLPGLGETSFDYSAYQVEGRPDLTMVVYTPATSQDAARIHQRLAQTA